MSKKYFVGIDGGGTKTHLVVIDESRNQIAEGFSQASSIDTVSYQTSISQIIDAFLNANINVTVSSIYAGIGGIASIQDSMDYKALLQELSFVDQNCEIECYNDVVGALASGEGKLEGIALILGTGSVCYGAIDHQTWRCGGYHYKEGDAGSAFDIGFQALKYYARVLDKRYPVSNFSEAIKDYLQIDDFSSFVKYFDCLSRTEVAQIAKIVTTFGTVNQYAYKILVDAANEVRLLVEGVYRKLSFDKTKLVVVGGLGTANTIYKQLYTQNIKKISPNIEIISSMYTPAFALAKIAMESYNKHHTTSQTGLEEHK
ncbi:MAG: hypothetical protein KJ971_02385 [Firmicutes bacterium]|nr:hypothetical protein [Bacillota bacterium]